ncbi:hypothetical protein V8C86DRAFT_1378474 [Haematococcus lacustris]
MGHTTTTSMLLCRPLASNFATRRGSGSATAASFMIGPASAMCLVAAIVAGHVSQQARHSPTNLPRRIIPEVTLNLPLVTIASIISNVSVQYTAEDVRWRSVRLDVHSHQRDSVALSENGMF